MTERAKPFHVTGEATRAAAIRLYKDKLLPAQHGLPCRYVNTIHGRDIKCPIGGVLPDEILQQLCTTFNGYAIHLIPSSFVTFDSEAQRIQQAHDSWANAVITASDRAERLEQQFLGIIDYAHAN